MARFHVSYVTKVEVVLEVDAQDYEAAEDVASEDGHRVVEEFLSTLGTATGDARIVRVNATLDGVGHDSIDEAG